MSRDPSKGLPRQSVQLSWCPEECWGEADTFLWVAQAGLSQDISPAESYFHHRGTAREQAQCSGCELGTSPLLRQVVGGRERKMLWRWLVTGVPTHCGGIRPSTAPKPGSCELCSSRAAPSVWREEGVSLDSCL